MVSHIVHKVLVVFFPRAREKNMSIAIFILEVHYLCGQTWANICSLPSYVCSIKMDSGHIICLDELSYEICLKQPTMTDSLSRRIINLVLFFTLETHNQANYKCMPKFIQTDSGPVV